MIFLKRALGTLLGPIPIGFFLIVAGLFAWLRNPSARRGPLLAGLGVFILGLSSNQGFSGFLIRSLELQYPVLTVSAWERAEPVKFIAVLGAGHVDHPDRSFVSQLGDSSLPRLVEAVRLCQIFPDAVLITCGPVGDGGAYSHAHVLAHAAVELGVEANRIHQIDGVYDTHDEILKIQAHVGQEATIIVTSAWHMPRAMGLARKAGIQAIANPTDYIGRSPHTSAWDWAIFNPASLFNTTKANREYLGLLWTRLRGQR
ncbi:MAG: envelope biogenesis factor ElyC [Synoicihabitans sp.]